MLLNKDTVAGFEKDIVANKVTANHLRSVCFPSNEWV